MGELLKIGGNLLKISGALGITSSVSGGVASNTASLTNVSGSTVTNFPLRIGRVFAEGEIVDKPVPLINGALVTTGVDVMTRWGDGSVQHAVMNTVVSSMTHNVAKTITFQNDAAHTDTAITKASMLADYDFDIVTSLTVGGVAKTVSARTMLTNDNYAVVYANAVATTIVLADHSTARAYDKGWFANTAIKPFRPTFYATFWSGINKVEWAALGECSNAEELSDITGNLAITKGFASPASAYTKTSLTTYVGTRWIVRGWIGTAPTAVVDLDHNLEYLASTYCFPNYDTSITVSGTAITTMYSLWTAADKDLYDISLWEKHMGNAGTRAEIGPMPTWTTLWLYTGDYRMREVALGTADRATYWPLQFRETMTGKRLQRSDAAGNSGLGRPISLTDRKTTCLFLESLYNFGSTLTGDKIKIVPEASGGAWATGDVHGWSPKITHQPDAFYSQYILTGDPFYLEQLQFWNATFAHFTQGDAVTVGYGRGPTGAEGGVEEEPRAHGWTMRNRANGWLATPDADPFKDYLYTLIEDHCAIQEGKWGITTGEFNGTTNWTWANTHSEYVQTNPLHFMDRGAPSKSWGQSPWMTYYYLYALGRAVELELPGEGILEWGAANLIGIVTDASMNPWQVQDYQMPGGPDASPGIVLTSYYSTWAQVFTADTYDHGSGQQNLSSGLNQASVALPNTDHPYALVGAMASAYVTPYTGGTAARAWLKTHVYDAIAGQSDTPKWAIIPRS